MLDLTPSTPEGDLLVVIETPKGSHNKYDFDPASGCLKLKKILPEGMVFPFDFGFIPSTLAEDGDPVDVLVLLDTAVPPLCLAQCRLIGAIEARQKEKGGRWQENDRLLAVSAHSRIHEKTAALDDLPPHQLEEIKGFFVDYNRLEGREFQPLADRGPKAAMKLVAAGMRTFKKAG